MFQINLVFHQQKVYASEEEEEENVNNLQKEFEKKINAYVDSDVDTDTGAYMNMNSDAYTEVDAYMEVDADMNIDTDMNMDADMDAYMDLRVDVNTNTDTDTESINNNEIFTIEHIEKHSIKNGFEVVKHRLQKNKRNKVVHHTFECKKSCKYHSQKKADTEDNCESVISDETKETYQWILKCLLCATNGLAPKVLFTNVDPAMIAAIHETILSTKHNYCI
ncbi:22336_t:CDS:2 [Cetraspora pellucida]|uniref:22336_t:CDS:1 n=1 Tax=Cetraspora pellucida TaxID=1433469 RepID=A0A9N9NGK1_9GLOM|nr:22336_t:CDS:2 [Cetraspora pellucida]